MNRALLVGINAFPPSPLRGCINDVQDIALLLEQEFGFANSQITLLTDGQATKAAIVAQLKTLIEDAASGDRILFHYSGHGTQ
jgi:metacaspase-1